MDVGGSFLELSCVRIAIIPAGSSLPDHRFQHLASYLTSFREIPVSALPRRAAIPKSTGAATFSAMPAGLRETFYETDSPQNLSRSLSGARDLGRPKRSSFISLKSPTPRNISAASANIDRLSKTDTQQRQSTTVSPLPVTFSSATLGSISASPQNQSTSSLSGKSLDAKHVELPSSSSRTASPSVPPFQVAELDLSGPDVDSCFRIRYDIVHRDTAGDLIVKPFSEWDEFHSSKIWGVFGIVDHTNIATANDRKHALEEDYEDFWIALDHFKDATVRRLVVFTSENCEQQSAPFVETEPVTPKKAPYSSAQFSVGYVPEKVKSDDTRLEVRAQIIHFAGLLLNAIDRDCWKKRESSPSELFLSPIDEKHTADRQSKLSKRRTGRLEKLLGDCSLLMGSPGEALIRYSSAIERAKTNGDRLWLAGAMEGWSAAHVLSHLGSGGAVDDPALSDRLLDHYSEIFKLYQRKRVAEPEAAAALQLAEFLGRWTNRRKDALDAAEHAATVGEVLKPQKRAALWEALARFSDRMSCRRKAALYLYRLGNLNASQSIWPSAVALMIASERQLSVEGRKPWATLNRRVLLNAAGHASDAGDLSTAARLYTEALVVSPRTSREDQRSADESILERLEKTHVPAYLPAASGVIHLKGCSALQIKGLTLRQEETPDAAKSRMAEHVKAKDGPFIYNPFEAKKRAKAAAIAKRAVTWVCGEQSQIATRLQNTLWTDLTVDIICALVEHGEKGANGESLLWESSSETHVSKLTGDDENAAASHTGLVRGLIESSREVAKTISETITLPAHIGREGAVRHITIIPKRTGPLRVTGLLVRLFHGALVVLRPQHVPGHTPPINVIGSLPRVSVSCHNDEGESVDRIPTRAPFTVFHGEVRKFRVELKNVGSSRITRLKARVASNGPEKLEITKHDLPWEDVVTGMEDPGGTKSFTVQVLAKNTGDQKHGVRKKPSPSHADEPTIVSIFAEYEGGESPGLMRESGSFLKILSKPAIRTGRITIFENYCRAEKPGAERTSKYSVALEVANEVSAPATVVLSENSEDFGREKNAVRNGFSEVSSDSCLVESGASARLICRLSNETIKTLREKLNSEKGASAERLDESGSAVFTVSWSLPALGRRGCLDITMNDFLKAMLRSVLVQELSHQHLSCVRQHVLRAEVKLTLLDRYQRNSEKTEADHAIASKTPNVVKAGSFWTVVVHVRNLCVTDLPTDSILDLELVQRDDRSISQRLHHAFIVGATENVVVGPLKPRAVFEHCVRVRIASTGTFQLIARLRDAGSDPGTMDRLTNLSGKKLLRGKSAEAETSADLALPLSQNSLKRTNRDAIRQSATDGPIITALAPESAGILSEGAAVFPDGMETTKQSGGLRSVVEKRAKQEGPVTHFAVHPSTIDTYSNSSICPTSLSVQASSVLTLSVVRDSTCTKVAPPSEVRRVAHTTHNDEVFRESQILSNDEVKYH